MLRLIRFNPQTWFFLGFWACVGLLSAGYYFQFVQKLEPCPFVHFPTYCHLPDRLVLLGRGLA